MNGHNEQRAEARSVDLAKKLSDILETIEGVDLDDETTDDAILELLRLVDVLVEEARNGL